LTHDLPTSAFIRGTKTQQGYYSRHGLPRARYPFRGCDGANHKVWKGRLYTDSLARSHPVCIGSSEMRSKQEKRHILMRRSYSKRTSTSQLHTPHTDGAAQRCFSYSSVCAYSSPKDGTSVRFSRHALIATPPSIDRAIAPGSKIEPPLTQHSRILARHLPPQPFPRLLVTQVRPSARTR
jgi:hypothetical protein